MWTQLSASITVLVNPSLLERHIKSISSKLDKKKRNTNIIEGSFEENNEENEKK